jgi:hypothetical protein
VIRRRYRGAAARLAAFALLALAAGLGPALAEGEVCRRGSHEYQPGAQQCFESVMYTCQDNGAWVSDRGATCLVPVYESKSCELSSHRHAAQGVRACVRGKRSLCNEGTWVDLGQRCSG